MALSALDQKQVDRLYNLLHRAERENDQDTAASLRWAIFTLEHPPTTPGTTQADLIMAYAMKPELELNEIIDTGAFNEIIKGYLVVALQDIGKSPADIEEALTALESAFDDTDATQARKTYKEL